jgi:hypothetical protein
MLVTMADFIRDLPLSWREPADESDVSSDWSDAIAGVLRAEAALFRTQGEPDQASRLVERAAHAVRLAVPDGDAATALDALADQLPTGRKASIRALDTVVYDYLAAAKQLGVVPQLAARTSGAVSLYRAAKAPTEIRAVIKGHALHATDADWSFGSGPTLEAPAVELLEFLGGIGLTAPRPAAPTP